MLAEERIDLLRKELTDLLKEAHLLLKGANRRIDLRTKARLEEQIGLLMEERLTEASIHLLTETLLMEEWLMKELLEGGRSTCC